MINNRKLSNFNIISKGHLWVNIPVIILILVVWYGLFRIVNLSSAISILLAGAVGWIYWKFSIKKWVSWALDNDVSQERLLKLGQVSMLLWNKTTIDKVINFKK